MLPSFLQCLSDIHNPSDTHADYTPGFSRPHVYNRDGLSTGGFDFSLGMQSTET